MPTSSTLGTLATAPRLPARAPPLYTPPPPTSARALPLWLTLPLASLGLGGALLVQLSLKPAHAHPHTHAERDLWQASVYFHVMTGYFALEAASPLVHAVFARASPVLALGVHCDYFALWSASAILALPLELAHDAGDVPLARLPMAALYACLAALLVLRVVAFFRVARALLST